MNCCILSLYYSSVPTTLLLGFTTLQFLQLIIMINYIQISTKFSIRNYSVPALAEYPLMFLFHPPSD